jgi:hypothetical protein
MPKTKISEWSSTPANNTDIDSINIAEGCAPSGINDAIRELMAQVKDLYAGTSGDTIAVAGGGTGVGTLTGIVKGNGTSAFTAVTAPTGAIVGTTDTQTLTNKTLTAPTIASANLTTALTLTGAAGTSGQVLTSGGSGAAPTWTTVSGGGGGAATPTALGTVYGKTDNGSPYNTFLGYNSGLISTGVQNIGVGRDSLVANTSGQQSVALGTGAMYSNTSGSNSVAVGKDALVYNTTAGNLTSVGYQALKSNTTGEENTAVGYQALQANTTNYRLTALGWKAGYACTGNESVFIGYRAGTSVTTGVANTLVGPYAGDYQNAITTGSNNVVLGYAGGLAAGTDTHEIFINTVYNASGKGSSTGFINPNGGGVYQGNNSAAWSVASDQRLKKNIVDNTVGLDAISLIRVRNFEYRLPEEVTELQQTQAIQKTGVQLGVIAQELQAVLPDCVKTESTGVMTVDQDNLTWYLINAVKELTARVKQLEGS